MVEITKSKAGFVYIEGVGWGPTEDFDFTVSGDNITVTRTKTGTVELEDVPFYDIADENGDPYSSIEDAVAGLSRITETVPIGVTRHSVFFSGVIRCDDDNGWTAFSENEEHGSLGTGDYPNEESLRLGWPVPKGAVLKSFNILGRSDSNEILDLKLCLRDLTCEPVIEGKLENEFIDIFLGDIGASNGGLGDSIDKRLSTMPLGDYVCGAHSSIVPYFKPVGTLTGTRYYYAKMRLDFEI